jgi:hypothetical protein
MNTFQLADGLGSQHVYIEDKADFFAIDIASNQCMARLLAI